jgi:hypothetical protein
MAPQVCFSLELATFIENTIIVPTRMAGPPGRWLQPFPVAIHRSAGRYDGKIKSSVATQRRLTFPQGTAVPQRNRHPTRVWAEARHLCSQKLL